jgi:hypothetical protein
MAETKKSGTARFSTEPETLGGTDSQGQTSDDIGTKTGNSYIYRTKNGKTNLMGLALPDDQAKDYASELQRETRGMKRGGKVKKMAKGGVTKSAPQRSTGYRGYGIAKKV